MDIGLLPRGRKLLESREVHRVRRMEQAEMYTKMQAQDQLFNHLELARDGGLLFEAAQLYKPARIIPAIVACFCIALNVQQLVVQNCQLLTTDHDNIKDRLNLTEILMARWGMAHKHTAEKLVACYELVAVAYLCTLTIVTTLRILYARSGFGRWFATARFFLGDLPELKYFSAMRLLQHLLPYVLMQESQALLQDFKDRYNKGEKMPRMILEALSFVAIRLVVLVFGFDAFIVKFRAASEWASVACFMSFIKTAAFLNQTVGIVQIERITMQRVMIFVFGGVDSIINGEECRVMQAYLARLFEKIWTSPSSSWRQALVVSLSFQDQDFQSLMLNERKKDIRLEY
mmetsp:Transcript_94431/g.182107  ORF Transcript_94431/g.182107 Transcript_94431/m.182107 type:complete len:345 (-) Transcript_94431:144-1178(-)